MVQISYSSHPTATSLSCSPAAFAPGDATVCIATVTDSASGDGTTPTGTVGFSSSQGGSFFPSSCTLAGTGPAASCPTIFTAFTTGSRVITAAYGGSGGHEPSTGTTSVGVALPASTNGCVVFGRGAITAANGDRATFAEIAFGSQPRGLQIYRDAGPTQPFRLRTGSVVALTCRADGTRATAFGDATLGSGETVQYRVDVERAMRARTYRIRLSNGYDSAAQPLRHGVIRIFFAGHRGR
jgi:hypothetical protein